MSASGGPASLALIEAVLRETFSLALGDGWQHEALGDLGLDSLHLVELHMELETRLGRSLGGDDPVDASLAQLSPQQLAERLDGLRRG